MGNWASRIGCLGERRSRLKAGTKAQEGPSPSTDLQGLQPPGVSWAWWGTHAIQVTEVTETVVTETVVTEAVEVGPGQQGRQPTQTLPALLNTLQSWLDGMEELQASQGPLAADASVAAAQLREQELLQYLLEERAPQVEPRLQEVGNPAKLCARWRCLVQWAETRLGLLQQLVPAAQSFAAARETLLARLGPGERLLAELGQGQLGPKSQDRVMQHLQLLCEGATACAEDLGRALETGRRLAELLAEDEAQLVNQQLEGLRDCVRMTMSGAARIWQVLLRSQKIGSCEPLTPAGLEAQLDPEGVASEGPGLKDQEELSVQLAQLAEWLEQLPSQAEAPGQAAGPKVLIQEQCLQPSTLEPSKILAVSWPWQGGINLEGTYNLNLLMNLPGSQAAMSCPLRERARNLEKTLLPAGHLVEELRTCPHGVSQAEPLGTEVAHVRGWRLEILPEVLGADGLKLWTAAPVQVLVWRGPDWTALPRVSLEGLIWKLPRVEATQGSWNHRKLETRERSWQDKDCLEQDLTDSALASDRRGRDGLVYLATAGGRGSAPQLITVLGSELPNSQQPPPRSMARAGDPDGSKHAGCQRWVHGPRSLGAQVAQGALMVRVGGGWVALDEFLVKNDPGRAKGRTSHKIHERFWCWAGTQKHRRAQDIIALRIWASIPRASSRTLPRKGCQPARYTEIPAFSRSRLLKDLRSKTPEDTRTQQILNREQCVE